MNSTKITFACVALFALAGTAHAQTTSDSNSASYSNSAASSGTSSISGSGNSTNTSVSSLRNSGNSQATSSLRGSGNSSVSVSVTLPSASQLASANTPSSGSSATPVANQAVGSPGSSAYNTQSQENVSYSGTQTVKTNPAIQAPGLTTTLSDTCMGSVSFGFSAPGFGATAGSTLVDQACVRRLDAREFRAMGLTDVALALLCQSDANRRAVEATGHLCPGTTAPLAKATGEYSPMATVSDDVKYRDPIVRERLGLPALDRSAAVQAQAAAQAVAQPVAQRVAQPIGQTSAEPAMQTAPTAGTQAAVSADTDNVQSMPVESVVAKISALK